MGSALSRLEREHVRDGLALPGDDGADPVEIAGQLKALHAELFRIHRL